MMPTSLRMSRHDFNTYSARSLDLAGRYTAKFAARDRKSSEKVGMFAFWAIRRCVRPYPGRRPGSAGRRIDTSTKIAPGPEKKVRDFVQNIYFPLVLYKMLLETILQAPWRPASAAPRSAICTPRFRISLPPPSVQVLTKCDQCELSSAAKNP